MKKDKQFRSACRPIGEFWCVEVAASDESVMVRDSKNPDMVLTFTYREWDTFIQGVKEDQFSI